MASERKHTSNNTSDSGTTIRRSRVTYHIKRPYLDDQPSSGDSRRSSRRSIPEKPRERSPAGRAREHDLATGQVEERRPRASSVDRASSPLSSRTASPKPSPLRHSTPALSLKIPETTGSSYEVKKVQPASSSVKVATPSSPLVKKPAKTEVKRNEPPPPPLPRRPERGLPTATETKGTVSGHQTKPSSSRPNRSDTSSPRPARAGIASKFMEAIDEEDKQNKVQSQTSGHRHNASIPSQPTTPLLWAKIGERGRGTEGHDYSTRDRDAYVSQELGKMRVQAILDGDSRGFNENLWEGIDEFMGLPNKNKSSRR